MSSGPRRQKTYAELVEEIRARDPLVVEAVEDVDRSMIHLALEKSPLERVQACADLAVFILRVRRAS